MSQPHPTSSVLRFVDADDNVTLHLDVAGPAFRTLTGQSFVLCPDLLSIEQIGEADGWRGRIVRGFFRVLAAMDRMASHG